MVELLLRYGVDAWVALPAHDEDWVLTGAWAIDVLLDDFSGVDVTALYLACPKLHLAIVQQLRKYSLEENLDMSMVLFAACHQGSASKALLEHGAPIDAASNP